jgi:hypothetical protein
MAATDLEPILRLLEDARDQGRYLEAAAALRCLRALAPGDAGVEIAFARACFYAGLWNEAWDAYEVRFRLMPEAYPQVTRDGQPVPPWRGGAVPDSLLVLGEQGLGDTIQFARYLPLLRDRGVRVHVVLDPRLHRLLAPLCAGMDLRASVDPEGIAASAWLPLMNLPRALGLWPQEYAGRIPYLQAEAERIARWRRRIGAEGFRVGIVWQGNPAAPVDRHRSAPLAAFAPLAGMQGVRLFSLQKGPGEEQEAPFPLDRLGPELDNGPDWFLDTAAAIVVLDLVVSVDTAVVHLAGALGRPVLMLAHGRHADWRWQHGREDSLWYPTLRIIRCPDGGADWRAAAARAAFLIRTGNLPPPV